jgi:hypothetical protein
MKSLTQKIKWLIIPSVAVIMGSCYPSADLIVEELDITATILYDEDVDFNNFKTFILPDSIVQIGDPDDPGYIELPLDNQDEILNLIQSNFENLGYVEELDPRNNEPDVVVLVEVIAQENYVLYTYPPGGWWGWWGWYPWYPGWGWGPGWGPGYPGGGVGVQSYPEGTLIVDMLDAGVPSNEEDIPLLWTGVLNGLLYESNNPNRVSNGINQMFAQSQYLRTN